MSNRIAIYVHFDRQDKPLYCGIKYDDSITLLPLYLRGTGASIHDVRLTEKRIKDLIVKGSANGLDIVLTNFKLILAWLRLEHYRAEYNVYDVDIDDATPENIIAHTEANTNYLFGAELLPCQKLLANASVVYQAFEDKGVLFNYKKYNPKWSLKTYSGRSKVERGLVHGFTDGDIVYDPLWPESDVFVHFDWVSADLRVAAMFSGDAELNASFKTSDPYEYLMSKFNTGGENDLTRQEAKRALLMTINSHDTSSPIFGLYKDLGVWLGKLYDDIDNKREVTTILGRKVRYDENKLSMLNGVMQGSVAHAAQYSIRKIWESIGTRLFAEIHDSIVCTARPDIESINEIINAVIPIMTKPFKAYGIDTFFPVLISIGKEWRKWEQLKVVRDE